MVRARAALAALTGACLLLGVLGLRLAGTGADEPSMPVRAAVRVAPAAAVEAVARRARPLVGARTPTGWTVRFRAAAPGTPRAQADGGARRITVFVRAGDAAHRIAHDLAHELGHAWDAGHLDDAGRRAYLARRGAAGAPWWPAGAWSDYASGAGDFAEVYARCHAASPDFRSRLAPPPADACAALPAEARR
jgi:hypothetical protein